ncbi:glutamate receptor ionotropic, kainate 4-like [Argopecten irradians]|uniref:glutamate receptor ionotropic, kainate 4-like n=1 Tax=Argopecten irradians TaxID=31199 RepID=UPI0037106839
MALTTVIIGTILTNTVTGLDDIILLKLGIVRGPCVGFCKEQTTIKSVSGFSDVISANITWAYVDVSEPYTVLNTVNSMRYSDIDLVLLLADVDYHLNFSLLLDKKTQVLQWVIPSSNEADSDRVSLNNCGSSSTFMSLSENNQDTVDICRTESQADFNYNNAKGRRQYEPTGNALVDIIASIANHLKWSSTFVLTDKDDNLDALVHGLSAAGVSVVDGMIPDISSPRFERDFLAMIDYAVRELPNITIVCSMECVRTLLKKPFSIARWEVQRYAMRHMTRWLIVTFGDHSAADQLTDLETNLDNVVVIVIPDKFVRKSFLNGEDVQSYIQGVLGDIGSSYNMSEYNHSNTTIKDLTLAKFVSNNKVMCRWVAIEALMWTKTGRRFSTVGHVQESGRLLTSGDIFPNTKFGFNGRELLVSTNVWYPFVGKHENMTFSGFCIDMLDHLAISLNFTYRLTMPADGAWGMQFENGSFNGLVGQMERNEVDLIVAPMSIQTNREVVMDFSYPYFYEPTVMLLKKPDPSDKKWRTLIDPFTTTVLICIGISLPTVSFIMCMLEYLSPYYRGLPDRASMRGLHHFSDAFWYLYGALLTQGGEHMSDAVSGRTLLSFWWLFCIVMMATYSGNLIAFLTVTKEKLPFDTLSGMVNQDVYKWGTIGGTAFIDIFKTSQQRTFQQVWDGLSRFNRTEKDIFSFDPEVHISKVLSGDYVYLGDKTYNEITVRSRKECDLVLTKEEFIPLQYAVGLPNNSPYTRLFANEILSIHESGLLQIWKLKHWPKRSTCYGSMVPEATIVSLIDIQSAFYLIGIGIVVAVTVLICECGYSYWEKRTGRNTFVAKIIHKHTKRIM